MDLHDKSNEDLQQSMLAEISKAINELRCAKGDIKKAEGRLGFSVAALNILTDRTTGEKNNGIK